MVLGNRSFEKYGGLQIREDDCSYVWNIPVEVRCDWVNNTEKCQSSSYIFYAKILFCHFGTENDLLFGVGLAVLFLWLCYLFLILGTSADNFFCPSLSVIATMLNLSETIAGVTILAFGNGAPDLFTSLASSNDRGIIMFTELMGAGVFVTTIIAGSIAVFSPFKVRAKFFMRDSCFYILAVSWITFVTSDEIVHLWEAISLILVYVLFIIVVVLMQIYDSREEKRKRQLPAAIHADILPTYMTNQNIEALPKLHPRSVSLQTKLDVAILRELKNLTLQEEEAAKASKEQATTAHRPVGLFREFFFDLNPINGEEWRKASVPIKALLVIRSPVMLVLQFFIPVVNETTEKRGWSKLLNCLQIWLSPAAAMVLLNVWQTHIGPVPLIGIISIVTFFLSLVVFIITRSDMVPKYHNVFAIVGFLMAMLVVYAVAQEVMSALECIGYACSISEAMLGITLLAWGNSIGDLVSNITIARKGFARMGFSACFGGPMFNTLLGLGLTYGISAGSASPGYKIRIRVSDMSPGCLAFVLCSLVSSIIYFNATAFRARRSYGFLLYSLYLSFMLINLLSELHIIHPLGTDHRPDDGDLA